MKKVALIIGFITITIIAQAQLSSIELRAGTCYGKYSDASWSTDYGLSPDFSLLFGFNQDRNLSFYLGFNYQQRLFDGSEILNFPGVISYITSSRKRKEEVFFSFPLIMDINLYKQRVNLQLAYSLDHLKSVEEERISEFSNGEVHKGTTVQKNSIVPSRSTLDFSWMLGVSVNILKHKDFSFKVTPIYQISKSGYYAFRINIGASYQIKHKNE